MNVEQEEAVVVGGIIYAEANAGNVGGGMGGSGTSYSGGSGGGNGCRKGVGSLGKTRWRWRELWW